MVFVGMCWFDEWALRGRFWIGADAWVCHEENDVC